MVVALKQKAPKNNVAPVFEVSDGANDPDRTDDLIITNDLLYQLSYVGLKKWDKLYRFQAPKVKCWIAEKISSVEG